MEINTNAPAREPAAESEGSRYLRRKTSQNLKRSTVMNRRLLAKVRVVGKLSVLVLVLAFLISVGLHAYNSDTFTVQRITFQGCSQVDSRNLEATIRQNFSAHLLKIDLRQLRNRLEKETWIRRAEIRRILPADLLIHIQERVPSTILEVHGELMLADDDGVLLDRYDPKYGKLDVPVFRGVLGDSAEAYKLYQQENSDRVRMGLKMMAELESGSAAFTRNISEVDISDKANLRIMLVDDTAEVLLGDRDYLKRFQTLVSNMVQYRQLRDQYSDIASVDLRFDGQIIYRPRRSPDLQAIEAQRGKP